MYYVYIITNQYNKVLYTGVTNNLERRLYEHKNKINGGFTARYNVCKLVYFESTEDAQEAIAKEKQIKGMLRYKKVKLIRQTNPDWKDLSDPQ